MSTNAKPEMFAKYRLHAILCALLFLVCELISRPFAEFGVADDWSYVRSARALAETGHIVYNGWATAMLGWQLYPAALLIKLFGYSYTTCRMASLITAVVTVFLLQRIFVRSGVNERNASIATLALALCPIYMQLSVTFMSDVHGLFAIVLCAYACLRALEARSPNHAMAWLVFAALSNAVVGSARQLGWLGVLVLLPSTLWLMLGTRKVLVTGIAATVAGAAFVAWCLHWFKLQPGSIGEPLVGHLNGLHDVGKMVRELARGVLELPFLLTAIVIAFLPALRRRGKAFWGAMAAFALFYTAVAIKLTPSHGPGQILEPLLNDWISPVGFYYMAHASLASPPPVVLGTWVRIFLTALSLLCTWALVTFLLELRRFKPLAEGKDWRLSRRAVVTLFAPFLIAYSLLLIPRSLHELFDRYLIGLTPFAAVLLVRFYQDYVAPRLPTASIVVVAVVGVYGIASVHDLFAFDRARLALDRRAVASGVADTAVDGGFELDDDVELRHAAYINDDRLLLPPGYYRAMDPNRAPSCDGKSETDERYRELMPKVGFAFRPDACAGPAGIAPETYFAWLHLKPVAIYAVKYQGPYPAR